MSSQSIVHSGGAQRRMTTLLVGIVVEMEHETTRHENHENPIPHNDAGGDVSRTINRRVDCNDYNKDAIKPLYIVVYG
jgi:hypothetical protein